MTDVIETEVTNGKIIVESYCDPSRAGAHC